MHCKRYVGSVPEGRESCACSHMPIRENSNANSNLHLFKVGHEKYFLGVWLIAHAKFQTRSHWPSSPSSFLRHRSKKQNTTIHTIIRVLQSEWGIWQAICSWRTQRHRRRRPKTFALEFSPPSTESLPFSEPAPSSPNRVRAGVTISHRASISGNSAMSDDDDA